MSPYPSSATSTPAEGLVQLRREPRELSWPMGQSCSQSLSASSPVSSQDIQQGCWLFMTRACRSPESWSRQESWPIYQVSSVPRHSAAENSRTNQDRHWSHAVALAVRDWKKVSQHEEIMLVFPCLSK